MSFCSGVSAAALSVGLSCGGAAAPWCLLQSLKVAEQICSVAPPRAKHPLISVTAFFSTYHLLSVFLLRCVGGARPDRFSVFISCEWENGGRLRAPPPACCCWMNWCKYELFHAEHSRSCKYQPDSPPRLDSGSYFSSGLNQSPERLLQLGGRGGGQKDHSQKKQI